MAGKASTLDKYANMAAMGLTESAANTQTSAKFAFPFSIMDKMGLIIQRIEYDFVNILAALNSSGDRMTLAVTSASAVTDIMLQSDPMIIDSVKMSRYDFGTAASGFLLRQPYVKDFSSLPGGGILVAPNPLYFMIQGSGAGAACQASIRLYYTYMEMATDEYWQLVESRRVISS